MFTKIRNIDLYTKRLNFNTSKNEDFPVIVFLHDSFGCVDLWRDFPDQLGERAGLDVLIYDRQGYGKSESFTNDFRENNYMEIEADVLIELTEKLNIKNLILFGHSDGATISLIAGAKYPDRISCIISEAAHVFIENITIEGIKAAVKQFKKNDLKQKLSKYHGNKTDLLFKLWAETWLNKKFRDWNILDLLPQVICPTLVIQGENDEFGTQKQVEAIGENISGKAQTYMISNIRHSPHKEAGEQTLQKSIEFIQAVI